MPTLVELEKTLQKNVKNPNIFKVSKFDFASNSCVTKAKFSLSETALETMMHGSPMVWKVSGSGVCPTAAAQNRSVNSCMQGLQENCDNMRAPQGFQNFERTSEQQHNLTTTAIPFEPWNADKMGVQKFDPEMPYRKELWIEISDF